SQRSALGPLAASARAARAARVVRRRARARSRRARSRGSLDPWQSPLVNGAGCRHYQDASGLPGAALVVRVLRVRVRAMLSTTKLPLSSPLLELCRLTGIG